MSMHDFDQIWVNQDDAPKHEDNHQQPRWCAFQAPYPEVRIERPNPLYAQLLLKDYASMVSEFSAITQYLYHHHLLKARYPDVADLLECISIVEMSHMEFLGEAIVKLGGKPIYGTVTPQGISWWQGKYVHYGKNICDMLISDIQGEKDAIIQYQKHYGQIKDRYLRELLARIVRDEMEHIELLTEKLNKYCRKNRLD